MKLLHINIILFSLLSLNLLSQDKSTGYVNFNLDKSTIKPQNKYKDQGVTLLGCNTVVTNNETKYWKNAPEGLKWNTRNQVFSKIPYGYHNDEQTNKSYFVSKYYIASPPVFHRDKQGKPKKNTKYDIGIVTPHEFVFKGEKPVQQVFLDYNILKLVKIIYISIKFDKSFEGQEINIIPFNVDSKDFPRLDKKLYKNAKGASGIGFLDINSKMPKQFFLPYYNFKSTTNQHKKILNFDLTILNDIILNHNIYFKIKGEKNYTINLKDFYNKHKKDKNLEITLYCEPKTELPCGCVNPDKVKEIVK